MDLAKESFEKLRDASSSIDLEIELFARLDSVAREFKHDSSWLADVQPASDLGFRPPLDSLGPFRWSPWASLEWSLEDSTGKSASASEYLSQPHLVISILDTDACTVQSSFTLSRFALRILREQGLK